MSRRLAVAAVAVCLTTFAIAAEAAFTGIAKGRAKIEAAAGPRSMDTNIDFSGEVDGISVKEEGGKLIFSADVDAGLKMGNRQKHTKEAFETGKHKSVTLTVDKGKIKLPENDKKVSGEVSGDLAWRGKSKSVKVKYTVSRTGSDYHIKEAKFRFNFEHFGVAEICKMGVCVKSKRKQSDDLGEGGVLVTVTGLKVRE